MMRFVFGFSSVFLACAIWTRVNLPAPNPFPDLTTLLIRYVAAATFTSLAVASLVNYTWPRRFLTSRSGGTSAMFVGAFSACLSALLAGLFFAFISSDVPQQGFPILIASTATCTFIVLRLTPGPRCGRCTRCGYDISASLCFGRCPECGTTF
jgi:hypothetical protein